MASGRLRSHGESRSASVLVVAAATLVLLLPIAILVIRAVASGLPDFAVEGDMAATELAVREAAAGQRLLGPYSRFDFAHPGPAPFYLMVPAYSASGGSFSGLLLTALLINGVCAALAIAAAWRGGGAWAAAWMAVVTSLFLFFLRPTLLHSVWNPNLSLMPFLLATVAAAAAAVGRSGFLPVSVLAASFALQAHVGYLPPLAAVAAVVAAVRWWPRLRRGLLGTEGGRRWQSGHLWLAAIGASVMWLPTLVEQAKGDPGNLTRLAQFFGGSGAGHGVLSAADVVASTAQIFLLAPFGAEASGASVGGTAIGRLLTAMLLGCAVSAVLAWRKASPFAVILALLGIALHGAALLAVTRIIGSVEPYLIRWLTVLGPITAAGVLGAFLAPRAKARAQLPVGVAAAALLAAATAAGTVVAVGFPSLPTHAGAERYRRISAFIAATADGLEAAGVGAPAVGIFSHAVWDTAAGLTLGLEKRDVAVSVDPAWVRILGTGPGAAPDAGLILCSPAAATELAEEEGVTWLSGDQHVAVLLVRLPSEVEELRFAGALSVICCREGFHGPERGGFRWSRGRSALVQLPLRPGRSYEVEVDAAPATGPDRPQTVTVSLNDRALGGTTMRSGRSTYSFRLPAVLVRERNELRFSWTQTLVPRENDRRELGVRFDVLRVRPLGTDDR